jgi:hemoglobin/transferrin/lactoferrin receptor protein
MKKIFILWFVLGLMQVGYSQVIIIKCSETKEPIEGVNIISDNPKVTTITNSEGKADITTFQGSNKIVIKQVNFKDAEFSFKQLELLGFAIELLPNIFTTKEVVISVNRWEQRKLETPNRVATINMKEAAFQNPQTAADLLGMSGYAFIQKSQLGGGSPMLRGFATNRVLLVVDGVRMNNAIFRSGNLQNVISLDVNSLDGAEIIFGPGAVMYGSDAIGGVMSFNTLTPKFAPLNTVQPVVSGNAMTRFSSANLEKTGHLDLNIGFKKLALLTSVTYADYNDLRSGTKGGVPFFQRSNYVISYNNKDYMVPNEDPSLQVGSKYNQVNLMQKIHYKLTDHWNIDYGFHLSQTSKYNRYDRLYVMRTDGPYKDNLRWAEWYYGPQKWNMHRVEAAYTKPTLWFDKMRLIAAYQFFEESRFDREFMYKELRMQQDQVDALSFNFDFDKKINDKFTLYYGYEFVHNKVHSSADLTHVINKKTSATVTRYPDGSIWQSNGIYATAKYQLAEKWLFTSGLRYNHFLILADFDTTFFPFPFTSTRLSNGSLSGSLGFVYTPQKNWQVYMNLGTGFRTPNIDDMGKVFESVPGYLVVPNPDLKPEKVYNLDLGTVKSFGSFLKLDATIYCTYLTDAMVRKNFEFNGDTTIRYLGNKSRIQAVQNVTQIRVYGIQAGVEFFYKGFGLRSNISYQNGKEQAPDSLEYYPLRHAAPTFGSTHITYEFRNKFKADFYMVYNAKMNPQDLALTEKTNASYARNEKGEAYVEGWQTFNFKLAYFPHPFISITAGVENIADILYRPYSSGINAPGRNYITSLKVKF